MRDVQGPDRVIGALELAVRETGMDAAVVSEVAHDRETVLWSAGGDTVGLGPGASLALSDTICRRLLEGHISGVVPDTREVVSLRDVPHVRRGAIGAYLGVPVRTADARMYMLCCLARESRPGLGLDDLRFLEGLAETVRAAIEPA